MIPAFDYTPAGWVIYTITPGTSRLALVDTIDARLGHLTALLVAVLGERGELFRLLAPRTQDDYLGACSAMAEEVQALFDQLTAITPLAGGEAK